MRPAAIYGLLALLLVVAGFAIPAAIPDYRYEYTVEQGFRDPVTASGDIDPVPYPDLSDPEQSVFDEGLNRTDPVHRSTPVNGSHFVTGEDQVGYGENREAVRYRGENYTVVGNEIRPQFGLRYWGKPLLVGLGALIGALTALGVVAGRVVDRIG